MYNYFYFDVDT